MMNLFIVLISCLPKKSQIDEQATIPNVDPNIVAQGRDLFDQHMLAVGGKGAINRHQNKIVIGKIRHFDEITEWRFISYQTQDNRFMIWLQHPELGVVTKGFDGSIGWQGQVQQKSAPIYQKIEGNELERLKQQADFLEEAHHTTWYPHIISIEQDNFAGRIVQRVETINAAQERQDIFFDAENHLLLGNVRFEVLANNEPTTKKKKKELELQYQEIWTRYGHYVQVQDIYIPFSIEYSINGQNKVVLLEEAYFDVTPSERDYLFRKYNFVVDTNMISSPVQ
jgi:hypothetical protein